LKVGEPTTFKKTSRGYRRRRSGERWARDPPVDEIKKKEKEETQMKNWWEKCRVGQCCQKKHREKERWRDRVLGMAKG